MSSVVISVDAELGWGFHDLEEVPLRRIEYARHGWQQLHSLCERYSIPLTWAVVGHLLLEECDGQHQSHPTPPNWFARERGEWRLRPDLRFGGELVQALQASEINHDIGSHTFSHVIFDDPRMNETTIRAELHAAKEAAKPYDITYDSFVFPRNTVGYRELLAEAGFRVYRGGSPVHDRKQRQMEKIRATMNPGRIPLVEPVVDEYGLVNIPPSVFLFGFQGFPRVACETIWVDPIVRQVTGAIDNAIRSGGIVHLWLHPNDLISKRDITRLETIFAYIDGQRANGLLVETMADVADRVHKTNHNDTELPDPKKSGSKEKQPGTHQQL